MLLAGGACDRQILGFPLAFASACLCIHSYAVVRSQVLRNGLTPGLPAHTQAPIRAEGAAKANVRSTTYGQYTLLGMHGRIFALPTIDHTILHNVT